MEKVRCFISGMPGCGKTTMIERLLPYIKDYTGFITKDVREHGKRVGFDIEDIVTKERLPLARTGREKPTVGKYHIFIDNLERIALNAIERKANVLVIDEIGKMEFCSKRVKEKILDAIESNRNLVATLHRNYLHLARNNTLIWLEKGHWNETFERLRKLLKGVCK
ncbi:MAG: NTPase [Candidatus Diapherotrites archaeon]|nr:NTPase [Candidatus Diapherotrites archaeon]